MIIPILAVTASLVLAITMSAFKGKGKPKNDATEKGRYTAYYFQYAGSDDEAQYKIAGNWTVLPSNPGSDPCSGSNNYVCVMETTDLASGTTTALVNYLTNNHPSDSRDYCNTTSRVKHKRQEP